MSSYINVPSSKAVPRQSDLTVLSTLPLPPSTYEVAYGAPPPPVATSSTPTEHQHVEQPAEFIEFNPLAEPPVEKITERKLIERITNEYVATVLIRFGLESAVDQRSPARHSLAKNIFLALEKKYFPGQFTLSVTWLSIA